MTLLRFQASSLGTSEGTKSQGARRTAAEMRGLGAGRRSSLAREEEIKGGAEGRPVIGAEDTRPMSHLLGSGLQRGSVGGEGWARFQLCSGGLDEDAPGYPRGQ